MSCCETFLVWAHPVEHWEAECAVLAHFLVFEFEPLLDQFAKSGTAAIVTGQQVGLFSGPAYTVYKALTAVKLAHKLTAEARLIDGRLLYRGDRLL